MLAAAAQLAQEREAPPAPGTPHEFRLPAKETLQLDNGLSATFIEYGSVPKVTLLAVVRTGNIDEGEDTWLPDVAVEMMKEGTTTRSAFDIAKEAAGMGGALGLNVGAEQTTAGLSVLSDHAVGAVRLLADVLQNPRFPESELPRVLANFERSLAVARADPLCARGRGAGEARLRRSPVRPHAAARRTGRGLRHRKAARLLRPEFRRPAHARLCRGSLRPRGARGGAARRLRRLARGSAGNRPAGQARRGVAARARRQPGGTAIVGAHRRARARPVACPLFPDDADEQPAGRDIRLADHQQHPRGQGLQLFAGLLDQRAPRRRPVGHER